MDHNLINRVMEDFGIEFEDYYLSQLFLRNEFVCRKIVLTLKSRASPSLLFRVPYDKMKEFDVYEKMCGVSVLSDLVGSCIPETRKYVFPFPMVVQRWVVGEKFFLGVGDVCKLSLWISDLHKRTMVEGLVLKDHLSSIIVGVSPFLLVKELKVLNKFFADAMLVLDESVCFCHGDLTPMNVLVEKGNIYIIDWEDYEESCHYLYDLLHFRFFEERMKFSSLKNVNLKIFVI